MARPKYDAGAPTAKERIAGAFWSLMEQMPYDEITLAAITKAADVNHNTLYYHYDGIDDLAMQLVEEDLVPELPLRIMGGAFGTDDAVHAMLEDENLRLRFHRICLMASPNSPSWLVRHVRESVMNVWLASAGISSWDSLNEDEQMRLSFIMNGVTGLLGEYGSNGDIGVFKSFVGSDIGKAMMQELRKLAR